MSSLTSTTSRTVYVGDGVASAFNTAFWVKAKADLTVISRVIATGVNTVLVQDVDYTVSGLDTYSGATVQLIDGTGANLPLAVTLDLILQREPALAQTSDYSATPQLFGSSVTSDLDKATARDQFLQDQLKRAIRLDIAQDELAVLPDLPSARATKVLGFGSSGQLQLFDQGSGVADSANMTFSQSEAHAASISVQTKLRQMLSVTDFTNVDTTGVTDSSVGVGYAVAAGRILWWPKGVYRISVDTTINVPCIFDDGAILKPDSGKTVTFGGSAVVMAAATQQLFNLTAGGLIAGIGTANPECPVGWWGWFPSNNPATTTDTSDLFVKVLNSLGTKGVAIGLPGVYYSTHNYDAESAAGNVIRFRGCRDAYITNNALPLAGYPALLVSASADYNQDPPQSAVDMYTILKCTKSPFGEEDTASAYGHGTKVQMLHDCILWGKTGAAIGIHQLPIGASFKGLTIAQFSRAGLIWRNFDQHAMNRIALMNNGHGVAPSGTLYTAGVPDTAPSWMAGAQAVFTANPSAFQNYTSIGNGNGTNLTWREGFVWVGTHFQANKHGYAGIIAYSCGNLTLDTVQSYTAGVFSVQSVITEINCHFENFDSKGMGSGGTTDLNNNPFTAVYYDSYVRIYPGWQGQGHQPHAVTTRQTPFFFGGSQAYASNSVSPPNLIWDRGTGGALTIGQFSRYQMELQSGVANTGGAANTRVFTWQRRNLIADGFAGLLCARISLGGNASAWAQALMFIGGSHDAVTGYGQPAAVQIGSNLTNGLSGTLAVTFALTFTNENIVLTITFTGANWINTDPIVVELGSAAGMQAFSSS